MKTIMEILKDLDDLITHLHSQKVSVHDLNSAYTLMIMWHLRQRSDGKTLDGDKEN